MNKALEAARAKRAEMKAQGIDIERLNPIEKALKAPASLALAIGAKCYWCVGEDVDPGWRERVRNCEVRQCPLWPVRRPQ